MTKKTYDTFTLSTPEEYVHLLTLNRPEVANALNTRTAEELLAFFSEFVANPGEIRCLVITGAGDKAFCAGGDLKERNSMTDEQWLAQHALFERVILTMLDCPIPIIAAVNGAAFGGGCEITLNCDFAYASDTARFALTETRLGIMPGAGGTQNLPRAVGLRRAKEIIFTARPFTAKQAEKWGVVNEVFPLAELLPRTLEIAAAIAANAPLSIRQAKKSMHRGIEMDRRTALFFEVEAYNHLVGTEDRLEGVRAFNEKRKPEFKGK